MDTVVRVMNREGIGPYYGLTRNAVLREKLRSHSDIVIHPTPACDVDGVRMESDTFSAFKDMDQLESWFTPRELFLLEQEGYNAYEIVVEEIVWQSAKQVIFRPVKGTKLCDMYSVK